MDQNRLMPFIIYIIVFRIVYQYLVMDTIEDKSDGEQLIKIYRHLHRTPEIGLKQYSTTAFIKQYVSKLADVQIIQPEVKTDLETGLIVRIRSAKSSEEENNHAYLFRCDIDALNFKEESGVEYCSQNGLHHACGHDAHTSIMLIAVKRIVKLREQLKRDIVFVFQPGEEGHGGASKLLQKYPSLLASVKHCFALHVGNHMYKSNLSISEQYVTANSNRFTIEVIGKTAHCMMPQSAIDANYIGCQIVNEIYSIKSRLTEPCTGLTIAVTKIEGGVGNPTSISGLMKIAGSIRSYQRKYHEKALKHIEKFTAGICELNGAEYKFTCTSNNYRAVKNDKKVNDIVAQAGKSIFEKIEYSKPCFAGQDFCQFSERKPSCYFCLGVALPSSINPETGQSNFPIHSNKFKLDESALEYGVRLWVNIALS